MCVCVLVCVRKCERVCVRGAQEVMADPVIAADGQTYDRTAIEAWLATKDTSVSATGGQGGCRFWVSVTLTHRPRASVTLPVGQFLSCCF